MGCLVLLLLMVLPLCCWAVGGLLIVADPLEKADYAVALSGDTGERILTAADLYHNGYVKGLILTNLDNASRGRMIQEAIAAGIPENRILWTRRIESSTRNEAVALRELTEQKQIKSLIIVTDPFHTFRTRLIFTSVFKGSGVDLSVRPVVGHWYRSWNWFLSAKGIQTTLFEYGKLIGFIFSPK